ncbi:hypothetical protein Cni_G17830 [Canna indica]|uniref:Protein EARLY HEADING DATE 2 n=1 Tax=Canna indica TaxID=4628 RepID=A0AAQ3KN54_9LILI|nr:hypothetical protein Cni_G17830 [Canna indica]
MEGILAIQQHQAALAEENISNLTSASVEAISSTVSSANPNPVMKKKRNLPGNPADPDAEVIALSPKTLMATNRFVCEICGKGFQRDQNLQLHRRGHNLPWKLKQRDKEVRRKVYVCPEVSCVHHEPCRALGDLTGIKKHFSRKHGEKKWKCEKCAKKYAVQSDWKAHSKICGTREYRCDCGTLFSRRDSFITHRAFCDALGEDKSSINSITADPVMADHHLQFPHPFAASLDQPFPLHHPSILPADQLPHLSSHGLQHELSLKRPWLDFRENTNALSYLDLPSSIYPNDQNPGDLLPLTYQFPAAATAAASSSPHMSATALLQKAAQMGTAAVSRPSENIGQMASHTTTHHHAAFEVTAASASSYDLIGFASQQDVGGGSNFDMAMMNSLSSQAQGFHGSNFEDAFGEMLGSKRERSNEEGIRSEGMTRDFLGLRAYFPHGYP